jgi:hypothetical protein
LRTTSSERQGEGKTKCEGEGTDVHTRSVEEDDEGKEVEGGEEIEERICHGEVRTK